jgi:hypothetical protein
VENYLSIEIYKKRYSCPQKTWGKRALERPVAVGCNAPLILPITGKTEGVAMRSLILSIAACLATGVLTCTNQSQNTTELARLDIGAVDGMYTTDEAGTLVDGILHIGTDSSLGSPVVRIDADRTIRARLGAVGDIDVENAKLIYEAALRCENVQGQAYIEMLCWFSDKGEYFSRGLDNTVSGTTEWAVHRTPFFLKSGENPDSVKLNVVIDGSGTVWVSDVKLLRTEL